MPLALLNFMRFTWAQFLSLSRSLWMPSCPSGVSTAPLSLMSLSLVYFRQINVIDVVYHYIWYTNVFLFHILYIFHQSVIV